MNALIRLAVTSVVLGVGVSSTVACLRDSSPVSNPVHITIATGGPEGVYYPLGNALAKVYTDSIPDLEAKAGWGAASQVNVLAVENDKADLAFAFGLVVYAAYTRGTRLHPEPHTNMRGIAVLYPNSMQVMVRADSDVRSIRDLRGRPVAFGARAQGPVHGTAPQLALEEHGLERSDILERSLSFSDLTARVLRGELEAGIVLSGHPLDAFSEAAESEGIRILSFEREVIARVRSKRPFFKQVTIPRGTYYGQDDDVETLALENLLVCRDDLSEDLVYQLTKTFYESLPELANTHPAAAQIDPDQGPITPIPLHPGAARYYRERELSRW